MSIATNDNLNKLFYCALGMATIYLVDKKLEQIRFQYIEPKPREQDIAEVALDQIGETLSAVGTTFLEAGKAIILPSVFLTIILPLKILSKGLEFGLNIFKWGVVIPLEITAISFLKGVEATAKAVILLTFAIVFFPMIFPLLIVAPIMLPLMAPLIILAIFTKIIIRPFEILFNPWSPCRY